jgi:hypothetical protein
MKRSGQKILQSESSLEDSPKMPGSVVSNLCRRSLLQFCAHPDPSPLIASQNVTLKNGLSSPPSGYLSDHEEAFGMEKFLKLENKCRASI